MNVKVSSQVKSFYSKRQGISHRSQVEYIIANDVFSKRMELVQSARDRNLTLQQKDFLQRVNGNIVWGKQVTTRLRLSLHLRYFILMIILGVGLCIMNIRTHTIFGILQIIWLLLIWMTYMTINTMLHLIGGLNTMPE